MRFRMLNCGFIMMTFLHFLQYYEIEHLTRSSGVHVSTPSWTDNEQSTRFGK